MMKKIGSFLKIVLLSMFTFILSQVLLLHCRIPSYLQMVAVLSPELELQGWVKM